MVKKWINPAIHNNLRMNFKIITLEWILKQNIQWKKANCRSLHTLLCYIYKVLKQKNETKDSFSVYTDIAHFYQKQTGMRNTNLVGTGIVEMDWCKTQSPEWTGNVLKFGGGFAAFISL